MPKINHRNSVCVISLINHIYQLMTILQGKEIKLVRVINHISRLRLLFFLQNASLSKSLVIQLQEASFFNAQRPV